MTFALAVAGYAGLTAAVILYARGRAHPLLWRLTTAVIVLHVLLVWSERYEWRLAAATRNGYAGFVVFHAALAWILVASFRPPRQAALASVPAFAIVTVGAVGAVFRYAEVAPYRWVVLALALAGAAALATVAARRWRRPRR